MLALQNIAFPMNIHQAADIDAVVNNNQQLKAAVHGICGHYYKTIDVEKAMGDLTKVGSLLQLAYASSRCFPSSVKVAEIMCNYQSLIGDSWLVSTAFVESSLLALNYHRLALRHLKERNDPFKAMQMIVKTGEAAGKMATCSAQLACQAKTLCDKAEQAFLAAGTDKSATDETRKKVNSVIADLRAETASLQKLTTDLSQAVEEAREEEQKAAEEAKRQRKRGFFINVIAAVAGPVAIPIEIFAKVQEKNQEAMKNCLKLEEGIAQRRVSLQEMQREVNSKLAHSISRLADSTLEKNELATAIAALEVAVQTLGKIHTTFNNTRLFWAGVKNHCERLANTGSLEDCIDLEDEFEDAIKKSGLCWLGLARINLIASQSIAKCNSEVDAIMCNLPNSAEANQLIARLTSSMLKDLLE